MRELAVIGWPELILILTLIIPLFFIYLLYKLFSGLIEKKIRKIVREELEKESSRSS